MVTTSSFFIFYTLPPLPLPPLPLLYTLLKAMFVKPEEKTCSCKLHLAEHFVSADFTLAHDLGVLTQLRRLKRDDDTLDLILLTELKFAFYNDKNLVMHKQVKKDDKN